MNYFPQFSHRASVRTNIPLHTWPKAAGLALFLFVLTVSSPPLLSQESRGTPDAGKKVQPTATATVSISEIEKKEKALGLKPERKKVENEVPLPHNLPLPRGTKGETFKVSPAPQITASPTPQSTVASPTPQNSETPDQKTVPPNAKKKRVSGLEPEFPAIGDNGTRIPPDMGGAVGPNHIVTALNSEVRIQDKTGTTISTVLLDNFFAALGSNPAVFDPKVFYDPFAGRWVMVACANSFSPNSALLIAVSSTNDPTNPWTEYSFDVDSTNARWLDYPSIGFNKNWIVATGTLFPISSGPANTQVYIFDKAALYAGTSAPTVLIRPQSDGYVICPAITLDNSIATEYLVNDYNGNSGGNGYLRIFTITGTPTLPVFTTTTLLPNVNQPWAFCCDNSGCLDFAPQLGSTHKIQTNDSRMQGVVFQNGSLWCAHTAFLPATAPTHSAAQWWQINPATGNSQQFGRVEDTTAANFYAFPTIAVNAYNDVLLGYSSFSATQFASTNYSFRLHTDAPNTMHPTVQFKAGLASYFKIFTGSKNRWGDYSSTCIDPDDFSLWTLQEYAELPSSGTDRWGTEWNRWVPPVPNLYVKDRPEDLGAEPDPSTLPMWESDDIWLRKAQDSSHAFAHVTEDAEYRIGTSNPNYVYVDVRNRGGAASAGTEQLILYWAKAGSGLNWPDPWNGGIYFDPGPNTMLAGNVIGTVTLPVIAAGAEFIQEFAWNPPDPAVYTGALAADQNHFCLLARITTSVTTPYGMTFPEQANDFYGNVQKNNHIAWKNIHVYDLLPGNQAPAHITIGNFTKRKTSVKLRFTAMDAEGKHVLLNKGVLKVILGEKLKALSKRSPLTGEGMKRADNNSFQIVKEAGFLRNISLAPNEYAALDVAYVPTNTGEKLRGYAITVTQLEQINGQDRIVGGQTFVFGTVKGFGTSGGRNSPGKDTKQ